MFTIDALSHIFAGWPELGLTCLVLIVAQIVYVTFGFGAGLIAVGALALFLTDLQDVVVLLVLVSIPAEIYIVITSRKEISWRGVAIIIAGIAAGIPVGTWILRFGRPMIVLGLLAGFLIVIGVLMLLLTKAREVKWPKWSGPPIGLVSGVLAGVFGTGGPSMVLYYQLSGVSKSAFRAHLMTIFLSMALIRLPTYAFTGLITVERLTSAAMVLPAALLGGWLGHRLHLEMKEETFRRLVSVALVIIGLMLAARTYLDSA